MNTQNKLYTIQFFSLPNDQLRSQSPSSDHGTCGFPRAHEFHRFLQTHKCHRTHLTHGKKTKLTEKFELPETRVFELTEQRIPAPWSNPIYILSMTSMVWNISIGRLGLAACLCPLPAPVHLLLSWTWETGKSPWFLSNNWNHQCYQHSSHTKSKPQQLLGRKLTLSKPKPGQSCKALLFFTVPLGYSKEILHE